MMALGVCVTGRAIRDLTAECPHIWRSASVVRRIEHGVSVDKRLPRRRYASVEKQPLRSDSADSPAGLLNELPLTNRRFRCDLEDGIAAVSGNGWSCRSAAVIRSPGREGLGSPTLDRRRGSPRPPGAAATQPAGWMAAVTALLVIRAAVASPGPPATPTFSAPPGRARGCDRIPRSDRGRQRLESQALKAHHRCMYMSGPSRRVVCAPIEWHAPEPPQRDSESEPPTEPVREPAETAAPSSG